MPIPDTPQNFLISDLTETSITLTWNRVNGVVGYRIYRDDNKIGQSLGEFYTDASLSKTKSYKYQVSAYNSGGESAKSIVIVIAPASTSTNNCKDTNCLNYTSKAAAQAAYDADKICRADLDADKDGVACEEPGNTVKTCASTSNCGCSKYNKNPCQADPCCKWVVGSGCNCK